MAEPTFRAPKGTRDLLPPHSSRLRALINEFAAMAELNGFGEVISPIFEDFGVFERLGETTDVVSKEMFDFFDKGNPPQHLALRPELTASICRAFVEHRPIPPWKVWYEGPQFRYEKPQAGRYRQFNQVGVEVLGSDDPQVDVDVIVLASRFFASLGLRHVELALNSLGSAQDMGGRRAYQQQLKAFFESSFADLSPQSQATLKRNPLRVLDSKRLQDQEVIANAPVMIDFLDTASAQHFESVCAGLDALGVAYQISPRLVRGLDYYTHTTFEFVATAIAGAQNAIGGGGRYDGLVEDLGGPATGGIGFALGVDRLLLACDADEVFAAPSTAVDVFVVDVTGGTEALTVCDELRGAGLSTDRNYGHRSMKAQMKAANRSGAQVAVIIGQDELAAGEVTIKNMADGSQRRARKADLISALSSLNKENG